jgi:hypothetical protein
MLHYYRHIITSDAITLLGVGSAGFVTSLLSESHSQFENISIASCRWGALLNNKVVSLLSHTWLTLDAIDLHLRPRKATREDRVARHQPSTCSLAAMELFLLRI